MDKCIVCKWKADFVNQYFSCLNMENNLKVQQQLPAITSNMSHATH